jgi:hypothetical protein
VRFVDDALPKVDVEETRVLMVAVSVTFNVAKIADAARKSCENQPLVVVLLSNVALVEARVEIVAEAEVSEPIVPVAEVSEEIVPDAEVRSSIVPLVIVVVASADVPVP